MEDISGHFLNERTADLQLQLVCDPAAEVGWQDEANSVDEQPAKRARLDADASNTVPQRGTLLRQVPVHKLALAASSKLLDRQLYSDDFNKESAYTLAVRPEELDAAMTVLRFIYMKELGNASQSLLELSLVLGVANRWQVLSCTKKCIEEILSLPPEAFSSCDAVNALFSLQRYDLDTGSLQKLQKYTIKQLARLFAPQQDRGLTCEQVQQAAQLSHAAMMALVSSDEPGLDSENTLALLALTWADKWSQQGQGQSQEEVSQVVSHVHFQRCSPTLILDALPSLLGLPGVSRRDHQFLTTIALAKAKGQDQVVEQCIRSGSQLFGAAPSATPEPGGSGQAGGTSSQQQQQQLSLSLWQERPKRKYINTEACSIRARLPRAGLLQLLEKLGDAVEVAAAIIHGFSLQVVATLEPAPATVVFQLRTVQGSNTPVQLRVSRVRLRTSEGTFYANSTGRVVQKQVLAGLGADVRVQSENEGRDIMAFNHLFTDGPPGVGRVIDLEITLGELDGVTLSTPPSPVLNHWAAAGGRAAAALLEDHHMRHFRDRDRGVVEEMARMRARRMPFLERARLRPGQPPQPAPAPGGAAAGNGNAAAAPVPGAVPAGLAAPAAAPAPAPALRPAAHPFVEGLDEMFRERHQPLPWEPLFFGDDLDDDDDDDELEGILLGEAWGPGRAGARAGGAGGAGGGVPAAAPAPPGGAPEGQPNRAPNVALFVPVRHAPAQAPPQVRAQQQPPAQRAAEPRQQQQPAAGPGPAQPAAVQAGAGVAAPAAPPAPAPAAGGEPRGLLRRRDRQQQQQDREQQRDRHRVRFAALDLPF